MSKPRVDWQGFKEMKDALLRSIEAVPTNSMSNIVILHGVESFITQYQLTTDQLGAIGASMQMILSKTAKNTTLYAVAFRVLNAVDDQVMIKGNKPAVEL
jgi:hypothetical protein